MWGRLCDAVNVLLHGHVYADSESIVMVPAPNGDSYLCVRSENGTMTVVGPMPDPSAIIVRRPKEIP